MNFFLPKKVTFQKQKILKCQIVSDKMEEKKELQRLVMKYIEKQKVEMNQ